MNGADKPNAAALRVNADNRYLRGQVRILEHQLAGVRKALSEAMGLIGKLQVAVAELKGKYNVETRDGNTS